MTVNFPSDLVEADPLREPLKQKSRSRRAELKRGFEQAGQPATTRNDLRPDLELVEIEIAALKMPKRQLRKRDAHHVAEVVRSIQRFGYCRPILVGKDNQIVDGVGVVEAAKELGWSTIASIRVTHLTEPELRALRLSLDRMGQGREYDLEELRLEMVELLEEDQIILGFTDAELDQILQPPVVIEKDPLETFDDQQEPVTEIGDMWQLGDSLLLCGDAKDKASYERLLGDEKVQLGLTDPPYAVAVNKVVSTRHRDFVEGGGDMTQEAFEGLITSSFSLCREALLPGGLLLSFMDWRHTADLVNIGKALGFEHINTITWVKHQPGMGSLWRSQSEFVIALKKKGKHRNNVQLGSNGRDRSNVWMVAGAGTLGSDARTMLKDHPTPKPVQLLADAILDVTDRGDIVLDPFAGSGSTLIACGQVGRKARLIELDPLYCDLIIRRWQEATGQHAVLTETGDRFVAVAEMRSSLVTLQEADDER